MGAKADSIQKLKEAMQGSSLHLNTEKFEGIP